MSSLSADGFCRIKNVKFNVYVGRGQFEEQSTGPKCFIPLDANHPGDGTFECHVGFNPKLWKFQSRNAGVSKAELDHNGAPELHPAAVLENRAQKFEWEIETGTDQTVIRDPETKKVWTLPNAQSTPASPDVTLEEYREGDERQLWEFESVST